jgi:hypothetical protein
MLRLTLSNKFVPQYHKIHDVLNEVSHKTDIVITEFASTFEVMTFVTLFYGVLCGTEIMLHRMI